MDIQKDKKTKENIKGKRKRGLIVPLFLAYQYVIYRCVQQPAQGIQIVDRRKALTCICQDWDKKNFIFFCTYSIKPLLIFKVQNSLLLLTFSLLPIEEASSFFTTGFLYYSFCLLHCISDKVLTLKHNLYIFIVVNEHLINYV